MHPLRTPTTALLALALAGCLLDVEGPEPVTGAGGSGSSTTSTTTTSTTTTSTTTTTTGSSSSGGEGGAGGGEGGAGGTGPVDTCGDGVVGPTEDCEPGTLGPADKCVDCVAVEDACGTSATVDPWEECEGATASCTDCGITSGRCFQVPGVAVDFAWTSETSMGATSTLGGTGTFLEADGASCTLAGDRPVKVLRYDTGAHPEGLFVQARSSADGAEADAFNDTVLVATSGCNDFRLCTDGFFGTGVESLPIPNDGNLFPPGMTLFVGFADFDATQAGQFAYRATTFRHFASFASSLDGWTAAGGWTAYANGAHADFPGGVATLRSPAINVVGLAQVRVRLWHVLAQDGGGAKLRLFDEGDQATPLLEMAVADAGSEAEPVEYLMSLGAAPTPDTVRVELWVDGTDVGVAPNWDVDRIVVGR